MDTFDLATHLISTSSGQAFDKPTVQQELEFYALYKQATIGKCNTDAPSFFDFKGKMKWEAWSNLKDLSQSSAKAQYVEKVIGFFHASNKLSLASKEWQDEFQLLRRKAQTSQESADKVSYEEVFQARSSSQPSPDLAREIIHSRRGSRSISPLGLGEAIQFAKSQDSVTKVSNSLEAILQRLNDVEKRMQKLEASSKCEFKLSPSTLLFSVGIASFLWFQFRDKKS